MCYHDSRAVVAGNEFVKQDFFLALRDGIIRCPSTSFRSDSPKLSRANFWVSGEDRYFMKPTPFQMHIRNPEHLHEILFPKIAVIEYYSL